jgi:molecular chaperone DnaJ
MCGGTGYYTRHSGGFGTFFSQTGPCPYCGGSGNDIKSPCPFCKGSGEETEYEDKTIMIPQGIFDGAALKMDGQGAVYHGRGNGVNGDLYIVFQVIPDALYSRDGDNLIYNMQLSLKEALTGCKKPMKNLDGTTLSVNIPPLTLSGTQLRVAGKGFVSIKGFNSVGDLMIKVRYNAPKNLNDEQIKLLEKFCEIEEKK